MIKMLDQVRLQYQTDRRARLRQQLLRQEAAIGGQLFGPVSPKANRYFFRISGHTWIWHEEVLDKHTGQRIIVTTRYELRPTGILKSQNGQHYRYADLQESRNLYQAIRMYYQRVGAEVYGLQVTI